MTSVVSSKTPEGGFPMKSVCLSLMLLVSYTVCFAAGNEIRFVPYYIIPGDDDTWSNAYGLEAQYIIWNTPKLGFAFAGGIGSWQVNENALVIYDPDLGAAAIAQPDGNALTFPLGASVLFRPSAVGTIECGLRYVFVSSNVDVGATYSNIHVKDNVDIDDGLVGLVGADWAYPITPTVNVGFGAGYQFDISKGSVSWRGIDLEDNELKGFYLRLGLNLTM
jgi:hypothetical protein